MQEEMEKLSRRHGCYKCRFMYAATSRALEDSYSSRWIWVIVCLMATQRLSGPTKHVMLPYFHVKDLLESYLFG